MHQRHKGGLAESIAAEYLTQKGFEILEVNYSFLGGELDIIAREGDEIVFVEVKSVEEHTGFSIFETVSASKLRKLEKTVNHWLLTHDQLGSKWRVDFVGLVFDGQGKVSKLEHIPHLTL